MVPYKMTSLLIQKTGPHNILNILLVNVRIALTKIVAKSTKNFKIFGLFPLAINAFDFSLRYFHVFLALALK